jgi:tryptophan synthase alpha chain
LHERGEKALVLFVTGGDPSLSQLPDVLSSLAEAGADVIEVGLPFSDPIADGPTIQASSKRALDSGVTPMQVLETLATCSVPVPVVLMGYYNTVLRHGLREFADAARCANVAGTIISDLTVEEADPWIEASRQHDLDNIFLAAPTSTDARLETICARTTGFVYAVSRTGVTGQATTLPPDVPELVARIRTYTPLPVCVGFGISNPEHVRTVCQVADGAVVGSWLVSLLHDEWREGSGAALVRQQVAELKAATRP